MCKVLTLKHTYFFSFSFLHFTAILPFQRVMLSNEVFLVFNSAVVFLGVPHLRNRSRNESGENLRSRSRSIFKQPFLDLSPSRENQGNRNTSWSRKNLGNGNRCRTRSRGKVGGFKPGKTEEQEQREAEEKKQKDLQAAISPLMSGRDSSVIANALLLLIILWSSAVVFLKLFL